jgi:hypothetical protein
VVLLDEPVTGIPIAELAPTGYLGRFPQRELVKQLVETVGYGTEVRAADAGPQKPTPMSYPLRRQHTLGARTPGARQAVAACGTKP